MSLRQSELRKTVMLSEYVTEYEQMRNRIVEFLSKSQDSDVKITEVNLIPDDKSLIWAHQG